MKTKEIAFTLPLVITLYEFMFFDGNVRKRLLYLIPLLLTMLIIPLSLLNMDKPVGDIIGSVSEVTRDHPDLSRWSYLFTQFRVIVTYLRLLILPINQNLDYDYPVFHSLLDPEVFLSFFFLVSIFAFGVYLYRISRHPETNSPLKKGETGGCKTGTGTEEGTLSRRIKATTPSAPFPKGESVKDSSKVPCPPEVGFKQVGEGGLSSERRWSRLAAFGIFWFFITLAVESSVMPIKDVIFEHRVYLPSVGAIMAFSAAVFYVLSRKPSGFPLPTTYYLLPTVVISVVISVVIVLSVAAYQRNAVWKDGVSLWEDTVRKSPNKARPHNNLGLAYFDQGRIDEAVREYQIAIKLKPDFPEAYLNLGLVYFDQGRIDEAVREYQIAIKLKPDYAEAHNNLGNAYGRQGRLDEAIREFQTALKLKPDYAEIHYNLGVAYERQGRIDEAVNKYQAALKLRPDYVNARYSLGVAYGRQGRTDEAARAYQTALKLKPDYARAYQNLELLLRK